MTLEEKLRHLRKAERRDQELERALEYLRRLEHPRKRLPAQRVPKRIEEYVDGQLERNIFGEFFSARQALPFGRPYGKLRIGEVSTADLSPLSLFLENVHVPGPSEWVFLDTETTGLAGGTGTYAFLIGLGATEGSKFALRQFFLRDYPEEKAILAALAEALEAYAGVATFNGKTFDIPLLETRYAMARMQSPFSRLLHLDLLHPARRLWKLRLASCELQRLEAEVLGISRDGDISGSDIPQIYFDYLRTGNARGLQPVFYHNALDIVTLAALTVEVARAVSDAGAGTLASSLDLYSLSRIFDRAGARERSVNTCERALATGLPPSLEDRASWHLASQHKRRRKYELAVPIWIELTRRESEFTHLAFEELAIYHEHRRRDVKTACEFTEAALERLRESVGVAFKPSSKIHAPIQRFTHRLERLQRKSGRARSAAKLPLPPS